MCWHHISKGCMNMVFTEHGAKIYTLTGDKTRNRHREREREWVRPKTGNTDKDEMGIKPAKVPILTRTTCIIEQKFTNNIKCNLKKPSPLKVP